MDKINKQTFTLTYGNCAENHRSMEIIGSRLDEGLSKADLEQAKQYFENLGATCELVHLNSIIKSLVPKEDFEKINDAYVLIVRKGIEYVLGSGKTNELYMEQEVLKKDTKAFMYGRVVNKKARHNLCFSDFDQEADYENKKGTVVNFNRVPLTKKIRETIPKIITNSIVNKLQCEGNYYYDVNTTYIGWHSDLERDIVIAVRLGGDFPLYFRWYLDNKVIGKEFECVLSHGDMYMMSHKAVGTDGRKKSIYVLRHAAGPRSCVGLESTKKADDKKTDDKKTDDKKVNNKQKNKLIKKQKEIEV